jgi:hypothetical protein
MLMTSRGNNQQQQQHGQQQQQQQQQQHGQQTTHRRVRSRVYVYFLYLLFRLSLSSSPLLVGALEALGQIVRVDLDGGVVDAVPRTRLLRSAQHLALLGSLLRSVPAPSACERRGMQWW